MILLQEDLGIGSLGHRHAILRARDELRGGALAETRPASPIGGPVQPAAASSLMRVHAQRARLARALERAGARQAHRAATAQHAQHSVELASDEVRRLEARIAALDCQLAAGSVGLSKQGSALGLAVLGPGMDLAVPPTGEVGGLSGRGSKGGLSGAELVLGGESGRQRCEVGRVLVEAHHFQSHSAGVSTRHNWTGDV